jgi:hypothetical protein
VPILFHQKITKPNRRKRKAAQNTFVLNAPSKIFLKLTPFVNFILRAAFAALSFRQKKIQSRTEIRDKLSKALLYEKGKNVGEIDILWQ